MTFNPLDFRTVPAELNKSECALLLDVDALSSRQLAALKVGVSAVESFWEAVELDPDLKLKGHWPLGRCVFSALCLRDILHALGRQDAIPVRSGVETRTTSGDQRYCLTVGLTSYPRVAGMWNAHMFVQLGDILLDPTIGQTKRFWNNSPRSAAFLSQPPGDRKIEIEPGVVADVMFSHDYQHNECRIETTYFKLPLSADLRTRNWRGRGDALPKRRRGLVREAIEIHRARHAT